MKRSLACLYVACLRACWFDLWEEGCLNPNACTGKPLVIVINKIDVATLADLTKEEQKQITDLVDGVEGSKIVSISTLMDEGACLSARSCPFVCT